MMVSARSPAGAPRSQGQDGGVRTAKKAGLLAPFPHRFSTMAVAVLSEADGADHIPISSLGDELRSSQTVTRATGTVLLKVFSAPSYSA